MYLESYSDVDLSWHMHEVSDGERRRVQIVSGLMAPWDVLLLDEVRARSPRLLVCTSLRGTAADCRSDLLRSAQVTVDLDVLVRSRLLDFLVQETRERNATILYATHIFDGLDSFPTHLCHLQLGTTIAPSPLEWPLNLEQAGAREAVPEEVRARMDDPNRTGSKLLEVALHWLVEDKQKRIEKEVREGGKQKRGARGQGETTNSEDFYKKCVPNDGCGLAETLWADSVSRAGTTIRRVDEEAQPRIPFPILAYPIQPRIAFHVAHSLCTRAFNSQPSLCLYIEDFALASHLPLERRRSTPD